MGREKRMTDKQLGGMFSSASDEWATPQEFFDELNEEFHFTLDPAANEENHKCETFFTKKQNGLTCRWGGDTRCSAIPIRARDWKVGAKSVGGTQDERKHRSYATSGSNGHTMVSRVHLRQSRDSFCSRASEIRKRNKQRTVSEHGRHLGR